METEYLGNAYTTQSSNDGCVAVACPIDAGCAINASGTAACGANACPADICVTAGCVANVCINACTVVLQQSPSLIFLLLSNIFSVCQLHILLFHHCIVHGGVDFLMP